MINILREEFSDCRTVTFVEQNGGIPLLRVNNELATAEISLYGGQLIHYQPKGESQPLIWLSKNAIFKLGTAIRGGIPVCWPWFGAHETYPELPAHGFARTSMWSVESIEELQSGETVILLSMNRSEVFQQYLELEQEFNVALSLKISIGSTLEQVLISQNHGNKTVKLSEALHTYFNISDIAQVNLQGLGGKRYFNKLNHSTDNIGAEILSLEAETDQVFFHSGEEIILNDSGFQRKIHISRKNSQSIIVWNPWQEISQKMADMSNSGWKSMVCIEAANVMEHSVSIKAAEKHCLHMSLSVTNQAE
jgi:D-hexose-6-phosphate mutarotase